MNYIQLSERIKKILNQYHEGGVTEKDCINCSSPCCSAGGFAILENVILIYEKYKSEGLKREDFKFEGKLSFKEFVFKYFDVFTQEIKDDKEIVFFHMRSITQNNDLIELAGLCNYWEERLELFNRNPWMSRGCVFLNKKVSNWPEDDKDPLRGCILHSNQSGTHLTEKPIDCVFFTCHKPINAKEPTKEETQEWFEALANDYPNSVERFESLLGEKRNKNK